VHRQQLINKLDTKVKFAKIEQKRSVSEAVVGHSYIQLRKSYAWRDSNVVKELRVATFSIIKVMSNKLSME